MSDIIWMPSYMAAKVHECICPDCDSDLVESWGKGLKKVVEGTPIKLYCSNTKCNKLFKDHGPLGVHRVTVCHIGGI